VPFFFSELKGLLRGFFPSAELLSSDGLIRILFFLFSRRLARPPFLPSEIKSDDRLSLFLPPEAPGPCSVFSPFLSSSARLEVDVAGRFPPWLFPFFLS